MTRFPRIEDIDSVKELVEVARAEEAAGWWGMDHERYQALITRLADALEEMLTAEER